MAKLILICGLPGAGKTTLAKQLEIERSAVRLCPDEWIDQILADQSDKSELDRLRDPIEALQWDLAVKLLTQGVDVILEWGFWSREERKRYRSEAEAHGATVELIYLEVSREELWKRLSNRNADLPKGTFAVAERELDEWFSIFEPPQEDEF